MQKQRRCWCWQGKGAPVQRSSALSEPITARVENSCKTKHEIASRMHCASELCPVLRWCRRLRVVTLALLISATVAAKASCADAHWRIGYLGRRAKAGGGKDLSSVPGSVRVWLAPLARRCQCRSSNCAADEEQCWRMPIHQHSLPVNKSSCWFVSYVQIS